MTDEKYQVLILDDDYELGMMLREYLQHTKTCAVTCVNSEAEFWACLNQASFDILFLDYKLEGATGLEILERMGQAGIHIPTVMMTGEGSENIAARAIQSGAMDYLVKGEYSFTALLPLIQKAVRLSEMQRAMQQSLEQIGYQALLLDNMRDAVVVWGLDGAITYWNAAAEQLYGASAASRMGQPVEQFFFPFFDPPLSAEEIQRAGSLQLERRILAAPQAGDSPPARWVSAHITTLYREASRARPIGYMNVSRDISAIKLAEEQLQRRLDSEKLISTISGQFINLPYGETPQGIAAAMQLVMSFIRVDDASLLLWQAERLLPYQRFTRGDESLPGQAPAFDPAAAPWLIEQIQRHEIVVINHLADLPPEAARDRAAFQSLGLTSIIAVPLLHGGSLFGVMGFGATRPELRWTEEDIYVLKTFSELVASALVQSQMEEQILTAQAQIAQAVRLASIGGLASGVAHQISNPLTTIIAEAQILAHELDPSHPGHESARAIIEAGWRAQRVINELMNFSRSGQSSQERVSINQTIEQALLLAGADLQASGIQLDVDLDPAEPQMMANPRQMTDIWINLLLARAAFTRASQQRIRITSRALAGGQIRVDFCDDGIPIPMEEYDKIFEPRLIPTGAGRGTGMELSLCRELVRQNHGEIALSGSGMETTFRITFSTEGL